MADDFPKCRVLFLDDDPDRAEAFLHDRPEAIWVATAADCIARLAETWDEIHLDHDLGGETYVDVDRPDCGMEVVRWLTTEPRPHLAPARIVVHSWNRAAAEAMATAMTSAGYRAEAVRFRFPAPPELDPEPAAPGWLARTLGRLRRGRSSGP